MQDPDLQTFARQDDPGLLALNEWHHMVSSERSVFSPQSDVD